MSDLILSELEKKYLKGAGFKMGSISPSDKMQISWDISDHSADYSAYTIIKDGEIVASGSLDNRRDECAEFVSLLIRGAIKKHVQSGVCR